MSVVAWQLPRAPLRTRVLLSQASAAAVTLAGAVAMMRAVQLSTLYPAKAMLVFTAVSAIAFVSLEGRHPFDVFGAANLMTTMRAAVVALVAGLVGEPRTMPVAVFAAAAAVIVTSLDGVDGWLARRAGTTSEFGARYDMEIDALLILILAALAWHHGQAPRWIVLSGLMRYGFLAAGFIWTWMNRPLPDSIRRKAVCVLQIVGLAAIVSPAFAPPVSTVLAAVTLLSLTYSFAVDVVWLQQQRV